MVLIFKNQAVQDATYRQRRVIISYRRFGTAFQKSADITDIAAES